MSSVGRQEHLLCTLPFPEPIAITQRLRERFPGLKVTYVSFKEVQWNTDQHDDGIYSDATMIGTLGALPSASNKAPVLNFVHVFSAGTNHLEQSPVYQDTKITFTNSSGIHGPTIAEWVVMTMLVSNRHYNIMHNWQKEHTWGDSHSTSGNFFKLSDNVGKRLAVLGYGSIGRQVARISKAMGMDVIAYTASPRNTPESRKDDGYWVPGVGDPDGDIPSKWYSGSDKQSLHHFLGQDIDYLLISVPLTGKTKHLIGKEEFDILGRKHTYVINIARGDVLVQDELINALSTFRDSDGEKGIRGAAVDVTSPEPLPKDDKLWDAPNIIITPHISALSRDYIARCFSVLEENIERHLHGKRLLNIVDRETGYSSNASK